MKTSSKKVGGKIPVGILGATGSVGQKFVELLADHPWFEIKALAASDRSAGKKYKEAVRGFLASSMPEKIAKMTVLPCTPELPCSVVFSGLDASVAGEIETELASAGYIVISNSRNHRMDEDVPLLIPEVNSDHLKLAKYQSFSKKSPDGRGGIIVTNPNCSVIGLVIPLKPLHDEFGLEAVQVVTMQALSGAGYPGVSGLDITDNVIPFISGEEEKIQTEPLKILGSLKNGRVVPLRISISAQCHRVAVMDGHLEAVSVKLKRKASKEKIINVWKRFRAEPQMLKLPMAPRQPIHYFEEVNYPQPKLHRNLERGMAVSIGRLRNCSVLDYKFNVLSHNTIRGAAGAAILNAELMVKKGYIGKDC